MTALAPARLSAVSDRSAIAESRVRGALPLWGAVLTAFLAGFVLDGAFPDTGLWPLSFVGIAMVLVALRGRRSWSAFLVGLVFGLTFYLVHIEWATLFLGVVPWMALAGLEGFFVAIGCVLITLAYRWLPTVWPTTRGRVGLLPVVVAALWTLCEAVRSVWPYGGFSWGRIGMAYSEGPVTDLFAWIGISGVSFVIVWLTALAFELVLVSRGRSTITAPRAWVGAALTLGIAVSAVLAVPSWVTDDVGSMTVAAVQGNTKSGYFDQRGYDGEILDGHAAATLPVLDDDLDLVLWPEGAADLDPLESRAAAETVELIAEAADAPLILGTITERGDDVFNSSLLWQPGVGAIDVYDKRHPVPFGEYVPEREFFERLAPDLIGLIGREYTPGTNDPIFDVNGILVAVNICFDIVDDALMRESAASGATAIFAQSNNADFGRTDELDQQLSFARIRALELGRTVVNISTVGKSAIFAADGSTIDSLPYYEAGVMVQDIPLRSGLTPDVVAGAQLEWLISGFGLGVLLAGALLRPRRRPPIARA